MATKKKQYSRVPVLVYSPPTPKIGPGCHVKVGPEVLYVGLFQLEVCAKHLMIIAYCRYCTTVVVRWYLIQSVHKSEERNEGQYRQRLNLDVNCTPHRGQKTCPGTFSPKRVIGDKNEGTKKYQ